MSPVFVASNPGVIGKKNIKKNVDSVVRRGECLNKLLAWKINGGLIKKALIDRKLITKGGREKR